MSLSVCKERLETVTCYKTLFILIIANLRDNLLLSHHFWLGGPSYKTSDLKLRISKHSCKKPQVFENWWHKYILYESLSEGPQMGSLPVIKFTTLVWKKLWTFPNQIIIHPIHSLYCQLISALHWYIQCSSKEIICYIFQPIVFVFHTPKINFSNTQITRHSVLSMRDYS